MYYLMLEGTQSGPYSPGQVREMWSNGSVNGETLYWQEGYTEWLPLSTIADEFEGEKTTVPVAWRPYTVPKQSGNPTNFVLILILTILFPPIGIVAGIVWLCDPRTRSAGAAMLAIAVAILFLASMLFRGMLF